MTLSGQTRISWLHLSDFHLRTSQSWSQDVVLTSLIQDIKTNHSGKNRPDLLFLTGDLAFSGKHEEYVLVTDFIRQLQVATELPSEHIFMIPGNHDIDRDREEDAFNGARLKLISQTEVDRFLGDEHRRSTLFRREEAFRTFVNGISAGGGYYAPASFVHTRSIKVGPINVKVFLLDSSWLSEGGASDIGNLLIGERQVIDALAQCPDPGLTFALVHHPLAWLREFEQVPVENLLLDCVNVMLRGHVHAVDLRSVEVLEKRLTVFTAGAAYYTRTSDNSYCLGTIDLCTGIGQSVTHRYIQATKRWRPEAPSLWQVLKSGNPSIQLDKALEIVVPLGRVYANYKATLLAGLLTDVPWYWNDQLIWLSLQADVEGGDNPIGRIINNMKNLVYWKDVWDPGTWIREIDKLDQECHLALKKMAGASADLAKSLNEREQRARHLAQTILGNAESHTLPVIGELEELAKSGKWDDLYQILERWLSRDILTEAERANLERRKVQVLLKLDRIQEAIEIAQQIIQNGSQEAADFYLVAECCYVSRDFEQARTHLHKALDLQIDPDIVRDLALQIAGKTADQALVRRVMPHE
jgi:tetratricopeptide (TPR) repeat protein/predicted phosphodiesterase